MNRVTFELYGQHDYGSGLGTGTGVVHLMRAAANLFGSHDTGDLRWAYAQRELLGLALEHGNEKPQPALAAKLLTVDSEQLPLVGVLADDQQVTGEVSDTFAFEYERRNLRNGYVWLYIRNPETACTAEAIVVEDPSFRERQSQYATGVDDVFGVTGVRFYQLEALWNSVDGAAVVEEGKVHHYGNPVHRMLLELAAS